MAGNGKFKSSIAARQTSLRSSKVMGSSIALKLLGERESMACASLM
jgi:hypothetical protein